MPDAYDPLSAKLIEYVGFKAVQCSGYSFSISQGCSDEIDISLSENVANPAQGKRILDYLHRVGIADPHLVRVLNPIIYPSNKDWPE